MGRPVKFTKSAREKYCEAVSSGYNLRLASGFAGVCYGTSNFWYQTGKEEAKRIEKGQGENPENADYLKFFNAVEQARIEAGAQWQQTINTAAQTDPNWAFRMLTLWFPDEYREKPQIENTVNVNMGAITLEEWRAKQKKQIEQADEAIEIFADEEEIYGEIPVPSESA